MDALKKKIPITNMFFCQKVLTKNIPDVVVMVIFLQKRTKIYLLHYAKEQWTLHIAVSYLNKQMSKHS